MSFWRGIASDNIKNVKVDLAAYQSQTGGPLRLIKFCMQMKIINKSKKIGERSGLLIFKQVTGDLIYTLNILVGTLILILKIFKIKKDCNINDSVMTCRVFNFHY